MYIYIYIYIYIFILCNGSELRRGLLVDPELGLQNLVEYMRDLYLVTDVNL